MRVLLLLLAVLFCGPAHALDPYLTELLKQRQYREAWNAMLESSDSVPGWLVQFTRTSNGVDVPTQAVSIAGSSFRMGEVCKPHDCPDNKLTVVLKRGGPAWGLLRDGGRPRWLGRPDPGVQAILLRGLQ